MKKIFFEIYSKYIEGKNDLKVLGDMFESIDVDELIHILAYFNNIEIIPNKELLEFSGQLIDLNLSMLNRKRLEKKWTKMIIQDEIQKQKVDDFFEKNKQQIYINIVNELNFDEVIIEEVEASKEIKEPKDFYLKLIGKKISNIFSNTKIYDTGENVIFWSTNKNLKFDKQKITEFLNILSIINIKKYNFSFSILPQYDFKNMENENAIGIDIILNIFY